MNKESFITIMRTIEESNSTQDAERIIDLLSLEFNNREHTSDIVRWWIQSNLHDYDQLYRLLSYQNATIYKDEMTNQLYCGIQYTEDAKVDVQLIIGTYLSYSADERGHCVRGQVGGDELVVHVGDWLLYDGRCWTVER